MNKKFMIRAIELALKAYGQTSPNPIVGAVVVKNEKVVSEGYHKKAGLPHAEINAIKQAGKKANGADLYVTLEPCCHFGKTPPCTNAIIEAGIKRVFFGMKDPNPDVCGKGLRALKLAGIKVIGPVLEEECKNINRPFIKWITSKQPYVTAKIAITLDGRIADYNGKSKWISNEHSRKYVHILRSGADIIMVGCATAEKDKPRLNVRLDGYKGKQPVPMVVKKGTDLKKLFKELGEAGFQSILVEGGGRLHTSLLKENLIDQLIVFISPKILGNRGIAWIGDLGNASISNPYKLEINSLFNLGDNIVVEAKRTT